MTRHLSEYRPWTPGLFGDLRSEMNRVFDGLFEGEDRLSFFAPRANLSETEAEYEVTVDLPGLDSDAFEIEFKEGHLWITGEAKQEEEEKGKTYHRVERRTGSFRRVVSLGNDVDADKIDATYKNGVLSIKLPKVEQVRPKRIEVKG